MNNNQYNPENKPIRFIDPSYHTLFTIPDGGYINILQDDGEILTRKCSFITECHTKIGSAVYHICEFAEKMSHNGSIVEPCPAPEVVQGYVITDRMSVGDKAFVMAYNPDAVQKYVTWQGYADKNCGYDFGHYWPNRSVAWVDYYHRADSERSGKPYDHTRFIKQRQDRDDAR